MPRKKNDQEIIVGITDPEAESTIDPGARRSRMHVTPATDHTVERSIELERRKAMKDIAPAVDLGVEMTDGLIVDGL